MDFVSAGPNSRRRCKLIREFHIIRDWQKFCARLARLLKCEALDTEVEKAIRKLVRKKVR